MYGNYRRRGLAKFSTTFPSYKIAAFVDVNKITFTPNLYWHSIIELVDKNKAWHPVTVACMIWKVIAKLQNGSKKGQIHFALSAHPQLSSMYAIVIASMQRSQFHTSIISLPWCKKTQKPTQFHLRQTLRNNCSWTWLIIVLLARIDCREEHCLSSQTLNGSCLSPTKLVHFTVWLFTDK